jgi:acyl-homoserine lactone acylase PvdQ
MSGALPPTAHVPVLDPATGLIFNSNGEGTVTDIHEDSPDEYRLSQTMKTYLRAKTSALDLKTHRLFLSTEVSGKFTLLVVGE